ncbi:MAG: SPOR domain-containing protein [Porphyromonas sp.]|nr:SPOR domain-containing protein [Porphyromonas sp.]
MRSNISIKSVKPLFFVLFFLFASGSVWATKNDTPILSKDIFEVLARIEMGRGVVTIHQSPAIKALVGVNTNLDGKSYSEEAIGVGAITSDQKVVGYRVQIYNGNGAKGKSTAAYREKVIRETNPELATYLQFQAPSWKLRVGNFLTQAEAREAMVKLKKEFPAFARDMYVVRDAVYRF